MTIQEKIKQIRILSGLSQEEFATSIGLKRANYAQIELGKQLPTLPTIQDIVRNYNTSYEDLLDSEKLLQTDIVPSKSINGRSKAATGAVMVPPKNTPKQPVEYTPKHTPNLLNEPPMLRITSDKKDFIAIPIIDISVAAGGGYLNTEYMSTLAHIDMPNHLLKRGALYFWVKVKGESMAPTIPDSSYVLIRLLDRGDWESLSKEPVCAVVDTDGKGYIKRIKNRLSKGFITLMSDNPDKASNPNFNLESNEIHTLWYAECFLSWKFTNIHDQYYSRLQRLEDRFDEMVKKLNK